MYSTSGLRLGQILEDGQQLTKILFAANSPENACILPINTYGYTVVVAPVTAAVNCTYPKLKHKVKSLKCKSLRCKPSLQ